MRQLRLWRTLTALTALLALTFGLLAVLTGTGTEPASRSTTTATAPAGAVHRKGLDRHTAIAAVEAGLEPWRLTTSVSREIALPSPDGHSLVFAGGLQPQGGSTAAIYQLDPLSGHETQIGNLAVPSHDAAAAVAGGAGLMFGGGSGAPIAASERLPSLGSNPPVSSQAAGTPVAPLPDARSDDSAVSVGGVAYVLGGFDGSKGDAAVLSTIDGSSYRHVTDLPVPVRYAAVAALGRKIYVFGGDATSGPRSGAPVTTVQVVDVATHSASVAGNLPQPLAGAVAAVLGGTIYLAAGETVAATARPTAAPVSVGNIYAWAPSSGRALLAGHLPTAVSHAALAVVGGRAFVVGGETAPLALSSAVQMFEPNPRFGSAGTAGAGSPYYGDRLLIADRGNNRLLVLDDTGRIVWQYPSPTMPPPSGGFYYPDDAFFTHGGTGIIINQEENDTLVQLDYPSGKVVWSYGHPRQPGAAPGYLDNPDDAYLLRNGEVTVADPMNCRVLVLSPAKQILHQIGTAGACIHHPPQDLGSPNGDTPLPDGDLLVSEINGSWIDELTPSGETVWSVHLPIGYPSDPQLLGGGRYLVCNYENPGALLIFDRAGHILYEYGPQSGTGELDQPSLAEMLPSGVLMANDDYNDRMVAIDPATGALVWQYGETGVPGAARGLLSIPDGFDLLGPGGTFPTHPVTG